MPDPQIDFSQYGTAAPPPPAIDFSKYGQATPSVPPSAVSRFGSSLLSGLGITSDEQAKQFFTHPLKSLMDSIEAQGQLAQKAKAAYDRGDYMEAVQHGLNYLVPFVGQQTDAAGNQLKTGDIAGGIGRTLGAAVPIAAASPEVRAGVSTAAGAVADQGAAAVRAGARGANAVLQKAPGSIGAAAGAAIGRATGIPGATEIGGAAGYAMGKEILPQLRIPGEGAGLPGRVTGGPKVAPQFTPQPASEVAPEIAAPAANEVSDLASALKNTFGKGISAEDAQARATAAVAKHPGDFDSAFREAVSPETPQVKEPVQIAKPVAPVRVWNTPQRPQIDFSKYGKPAETFERTLVTANQREVLGAPDLGPTSIQLPKGPAPEVGTPQDIAETRNIQDAIRNQAEREAMLEDVGASRRFREGNAVEQGKWANVATARTGSDVSARVPYPRFTEGLEDINLHPFTGAAAQVPPEDRVPILEKALKQAKLAAKAKNRLAIPQ